MSTVRPKFKVREEGEEAQVQEFDDRNKNNNADLLLFDKKVAMAVEGLEPFFDKILRQRTLKENALLIAGYINTAKREINISNGL